MPTPSAPSSPTAPSTEKLLDHIFFSRKSANATRLLISGVVGDDGVLRRFPVQARLGHGQLFQPVWEFRSERQLVFHRDYERNVSCPD
jgi:hypothetical protein